jgi:hypothetical protein
MLLSVRYREDMSPRAALLLLTVCFALMMQGAGSRLLSNRNGESAAYTGIGRLEAGGWCTAFLLDTGVPAGPAYVLSNGHCVGLLAPNEVIVNRAQTGYRMVFNFFEDTKDRQDRVYSRRIAYATMKAIDFSVIELDATLGELTARGYRALSLAREAPGEGEKVLMAGVPGENMPAGDMFLRLGQCTLGPRVDVLELDWFWRGFYRNDCPDAKPGDSGAPLISESTGQVVAILNTTTTDSTGRGGDFNCYLNIPCEVGAQGERVLDDTSYAMPVMGLTACFDSGGSFSLAAPDCPLDPGRQPDLSRSGGRSLRPGAKWNVTVRPGPFAWFRYKTFREGSGDCRTPECYGRPRPIGSAARIESSIGVSEGRYFLCVVGGPGPRPDASWQPLRFASVLEARVDSTPPVIPPRYKLEDEPGRWVVKFQLEPPELNGYRWKAGAPRSTRCGDPAGYADFLRQPVEIPKSGGEKRFCVVARDEAGNQSPPVDLPLTNGASEAH